MSEIHDVLEGRRRWWVEQADCLSTLRALPDNCIDSLVTDPPAGIGFMDKTWDQDKGGREQWIAWLVEIMTRCMRVMKPGAHGLVWALPRTSHWTATALEDSGFEIRDIITHHFGTGFPKSLNVQGAIDDYFKEEDTPEGAEWEGTGTALKPASEHWILVRKSIDETVAKNVLRWGTGGMQIDACRIGEGDEGRWPANLVLSHAAACTQLQCSVGCPIAALDEQAGILKSGAHSEDEVRTTSKTKTVYGERAANPIGARSASQGGPSRFFYCAKPSRAERDAGLDQFPLFTGGAATDREEGSAGLKNPRAGAGRGGGVRNHHPTVKSVELMSWLCRLVTPPGGLVLDPFAGSGSTLIAATRQGFRALGIEREEAYCKIARARVENDAPLFNREGP